MRVQRTQSSKTRDSLGHSLLSQDKIMSKFPLESIKTELGQSIYYICSNEKKEKKLEFKSDLNLEIEYDNIHRKLHRMKLGLCCATG